MKTIAQPKLRRSALRLKPNRQVARLHPPPKEPASSGPCYPRVLIPLDLSPGGSANVRYVMKLPRSLVGSIWLLYVQPPDSFVNGLDSIPLVISDAVAFRSERHALEKILRQEVPPPRCGGALVRIGSPEHEIVQAARELDASLIVMTTHGYHGVRHLLHPSIAERVVRNAPCPVLTLNRALLGRRPVLREL